MRIGVALACVGMTIGLSGNLTAPATAKGWPTPAAGTSSSGDIEILLTFDDGPHPERTAKVLDILKEHKLHAVFFMVGERIESKKAKKPDAKAVAIVKRVLDEGHVIATHTWTHPTNICKLSAERAANEIDHGREVIEKAAHFNTVWFRTPSGARCDSLEEMLAARHLNHFHWDIDPQEWKKGKTPEQVIRTVTNEIARAQSRSVLLMHDIHEISVQALPEILKFIEEENVKRSKTKGKKLIRILEPSDLAREQMTPGLTAWLGEATANLRELPKMLATILP